MKSWPHAAWTTGLAEMKRHLGNRFPKYSENSERIRLLEDRDGDGKADHATVFADGFHTPLDGIGAGVLARKGNVWYANIPNFWLLRDTTAMASPISANRSTTASACASVSSAMTSTARISVRMGKSISASVTGLEREGRGWPARR